MDKYTAVGIFRVAKHYPCFGRLIFESEKEWFFQSKTNNGFVWTRLSPDSKKDVDRFIAIKDNRDYDPKYYYYCLVFSHDDVVIVTADELIDIAKGNKIVQQLDNDPEFKLTVIEYVNKVYG